MERIQHRIFKTPNAIKVRLKFAKNIPSLFLSSTCYEIICSRTKDAKADVLEMGENRSQMLKQILEGVYLRRDKAVALEDDLPTK
jgi:hypothetical protein